MDKSGKDSAAQREQAQEAQREGDGAAGRNTKRGSFRSRESVEKEEKQGTYFPVYPNLRDAKKRCGKVERNEENRKETRAS